MNKQQQFLWGIQTLILLDAENFSLSGRQARQNRQEISATGRFGDIMGAIEAGEQIPEDMSVQDAINQYYYWRLARYSDPRDRPKQPDWIKRQEW